MNQKRLLISAAIIGVVVVGGFLISVPHTTRDVVPAPVQEEASVRAPVVALRDVYKKGVHTISGSLLAPNACATATTTARLAGDADASQILVAIDLLSDTEVCLELPTTLTFSMKLEAPAELPIVVTVNGAHASTTEL